MSKVLGWENLRVSIHGVRVSTKLCLKLGRKGVIVGFNCVEDRLLKVLDKLLGSVSKRNRRLDKVVTEAIDIKDSSQGFVSKTDIPACWKRLNAWVFVSQFQ